MNITNIYDDAKKKELAKLKEFDTYEIKRVVRSTLAAETLSLQQGYEAAYYISQILREMIGVELPIQAVVDIKSVVESLYSTRMVHDKRLRIDIAALKENLGSNFDVKWCPGNEQLANVMTKHFADRNNRLICCFKHSRMHERFYIYFHIAICFICT